MKIFIDTNIWLRFLLADNQKQYPECVDLFTQIEQGKIRPYTSTIVFLELQYVLLTTLGLEKKAVTEDLDTILKTRNITLIDKTDFQKAFTYYKNYNIKFADCLIASQLPENVTLCTYDREFSKIKGLAITTPNEIISSLIS